MLPRNGPLQVVGAQGDQGVLMRQQDIQGIASGARGEKCY